MSAAKRTDSRRLWTGVASMALLLSGAVLGFMLNDGHSVAWAVVGVFATGLLLSQSVELWRYYRRGR